MNAIDRKAIGIGAPVRRVEDLRFLRGAGRFVDDIAAAGVAHLLCPALAARGGADRVDRTAAARAMPGVLLVLTAPTRHPGRGALRRPAAPAGRLAAGAAALSRAAAGRVRHVGEPVAAVVALTPPRRRMRPS